MEPELITINGTQELLAYHKATANSRIIKRNPQIPTTILKKFEGLNKLKKITYKKFSFRGDFSMKFVDCNFVDCEFVGVWAFYVEFIRCSFHQCNFRHCRFSHIDEWETIRFNKCSFRTTEIDEALLGDIEFYNCHFQNFSIDGSSISHIYFFDSYLERCQFSHLNYSGSEAFTDEDEDEVKDLGFADCQIFQTIFNTVELRNSVIHDSVLYKTVFIDSPLGADTLWRQKDLKSSSYATLDFQTIIKSDYIDPDTLSYYFNIRHPNMKKVINSITEDINFHTVFISYSFIDSPFVTKLNQELKERGIKTFLFEKDAPGGRPLLDIMSTNIQRYDKLLFIASHNSLRSKACQYELSEARRKQEKLWETTLFPIHIDNFLFEVEKRQVRPMELAEEFWNNIEELRRVNSVNMIEFNVEAYDIDKYREVVDKLAVDLLKEQKQ